MDFKIGDLVTRISYDNDIVFMITSIKDNIYYLKGANIRLCADSPLEDLCSFNESELENSDEDRDFLERIKENNATRCENYFYLPGKILHIDADAGYLKRCLNYYNDLNIWAKGIIGKEEDVPLHIYEWLEEYKPNIIVITGHDAYYQKQNQTYKNSSNFVASIKEARRFENSHEKLIIIAGACQSNYEELIKAGANFASSPKRVNIHALDPAIIAGKMSLASINEDIDLKKILEYTKYGASGIGGIITKGTMHIGFPR